MVLQLPTHRHRPSTITDPTKHTTWNPLFSDPFAATRNPTSPSPYTPRSTTPPKSFSTSPYGPAPTHPPTNPLPALPPKPPTTLLPHPPTLPEIPSRPTSLISQCSSNTLPPDHPHFEHHPGTRIDAWPSPALGLSSRRSTSSTNNLSSRRSTSSTNNLSRWSISTPSRSPSPPRHGSVVSHIKKIVGGSGRTSWAGTSKTAAAVREKPSRSRSVGSGWGDLEVRGRELWRRVGSEGRRQERAREEIKKAIRVIGMAAD